MKCAALVLVLSVSFTLVEATTGKSRALPAANLPEDCNTIERCCMPRPYTGKPGIRSFEFPKDQPTRIRKPAQHLDKAYVKKLEKAYKILRELPDSDPRSLKNQMNLHCLYCDNGLYFPGHKYPLEVHNGWFFLPWHRMFIYWHERILAKILDDETFALPYWNWDNQSPEPPFGNTIPEIYANPKSPLYDVNRNNCSVPPFVVDMDTRTGCTNKTSDFLRVQNTRLTYSQIVLGGGTPSLFYGLPYRKGDFGGAGSGVFEDQPHGTIHAWVGSVDPLPGRRPGDDMGNFGRSAFDPVFYAHHTNTDRLWELWLTKIPGGQRTHPTDPDFLNSEFTFYDEDANLVKMKVSQVLDSRKLRYKYAEMPTPWITNGLEAGKEHTVPHCNPLTKTQVKSLIEDTRVSKGNETLFVTPITFRLKRPKRRSEGTEVLEISGLFIPNITDQVHVKAYVFFPQAVITDGPVCPEFLGTFNFIPHIGQALYNPGRVWRAAVGPKLKALGLDYVNHVVFTIVQTGKPQMLSFQKARIIYDLSPEVTM